MRRLARPRLNTILSVSLFADVLQFRRTIISDLFHTLFSASGLSSLVERFAKILQILCFISRFLKGIRFFLSRIKYCVIGEKTCSYRQHDAIESVWNFYGFVWHERVHRMRYFAASCSLIVLFRLDSTK